MKYMFESGDDLVPAQKTISVILILMLKILHLTYTLFKEKYNIYHREKSVK